MKEDRITRDQLILGIQAWRKISERLVLDHGFFKSEDGVVVSVVSQRCGDGGGAGRSVCASEGCL